MAKRAAKSSSTDPAEIARLRFEQAVAQLEGIVERIESGDVPLEEALAQYERGVLLAGHCRQILGRAEQRIEDLSRSVMRGFESPGVPAADDDDEA